MLTVVWDFNGVITDDAAFYCEAFNKTLTQYGLPPVTLEEYRQANTAPSVKFWNNLGLTENMFSFKEFGERMNKHIDDNLTTVLRPGVQEALGHLLDYGVRQVVLTANIMERVMKQLQAANVLDYFEKVYGAQHGDFKFVKTKMAAQINADIPAGTKVVMVGDTPTDFAAAQTNGWDCVLVKDGHCSTDKLEATGCELADSVHGVFLQLRRIMTRQ
jgi:phosphoglycolate phosphatase-like HAD superfamily hydrolase